MCGAEILYMLFSLFLIDAEKKSMNVFKWAKEAAQQAAKKCFGNHLKGHDQQRLLMSQEDQSLSTCFVGQSLHKNGLLLICTLCKTDPISQRNNTALTLQWKT